MEDDLAKLTIMDGDEEEAFQEEEFKFCLVGCYLTDSVVHFPSLRNTFADLWHPIGGVFIKDLGEKRSLFKFFYEVDIKGSWKGLLGSLTIVAYCYIGSSRVKIHQRYHCGLKNFGYKSMICLRA